MRGENRGYKISVGRKRTKKIFLLQFVHAEAVPTPNFKPSLIVTSDATGSLGGLKISVRLGPHFIFCHQIIPKDLSFENL